MSHEIEAYTGALDADPKDHTIYSNRSAARMKLSQNGFAITHAFIAMPWDPPDPHQSVCVCDAG
jgi:hypothetical protein